MSDKLVSIIMPAYNCEKYIRQAVDSILNQTYTNFELLIADDCSTDNTKKIIEAYSDKRIKCFHNEKNLGYLKSCNKLIQHATGDYFTFLDADDINEPTRFEKQINFLKQNTHIQAVGCNRITIDSNGSKIAQSDFSLSNDEIVKDFNSYKIPCHYSSLIVKKEVINKLGLYNEYFDRVGSEDIYWFSHITQYFKIANISDFLYYYRKHSTSVTATHKNPKAFVCHDLIMKMYFRRKVGKQDFIENKNTWKMADVYVQFLIEIRNLKLVSKKMSIALLKLIIAHPIIALEYVSELKNIAFQK